jgi:ABC-type glycerol-3-phosphate transport system substrate-binding protein
LRVWLPPAFDPASGSDAGALLQARLDEFAQQHTGVEIEVRIKALSGPGGLMDSLTTASAAAPRALPDLVALPRDLMEIAALKGLLTPYDNLTSTLETSSDWYEYAQQLARLQNSVYGIPFAGDAMLLAYRPEVLPVSPADWPATLQTGLPLAFPAADPKALFTMALYQASGGAVLDDQGRPFLDAEILTEVLTFYAQAEQAGVMPAWLAEFQNDDAVWGAFQDSQAEMAATWSTRFLAEPVAGVSAASIPTPDGKPFTLATGWVWALASHQPERQALSVELGEFLTESRFLAGWTEAIGLLPSRPSALSAWSDPGLRAMMTPVALSARLIPSGDVLTGLGGALQQATLQVLTQQSNPVAAAQEAAAGLTGP